MLVSAIFFESNLQPFPVNSHLVYKIFDHHSMKRTFAVLLLLTFITLNTFGQSVSEKKFSSQQLREDLAYLKLQLFRVHAYPYSELSKEQYEQLFDKIDHQLKDSLTNIDFLKLIKPAVAYLSDEHASISLSPKMLPGVYQDEPVFFPLILSKKGNSYYLAKTLSNQTELLGQAIIQIDGIDIKDVVAKCALYTTGYPEQRAEKALAQFGYLYSISIPGAHHQYTIETDSKKAVTVQGVILQTWFNEITQQSGWNLACNEAISYQKINDAGYINACSFLVGDKKIDSLKQRLDVIFAQVQKDKLKYLFIDVSKNGGGNSSVGNVLIDYFYDKSYTTYRCYWKKSEEYLKLVQSWGIEPGNQYKEEQDGGVLHFPSDTIYAESNPYRFKGKVIVIIGNGTFSSAIMFATIIKDNHIAELAGEIPVNGHPNHFGEMYNTKLPNTQIDLRFGVKEWIRPSGEKTDNILRPDITIDPSITREKLVKEVIVKVK